MYIYAYGKATREGETRRAQARARVNQLSDDSFFLQLHISEPLCVHARYILRLYPSQRHSVAIYFLFSISKALNLANGRKAVLNETLKH